jgi:hypothetical protein
MNAHSPRCWALIIVGAALTAAACGGAGGGSPTSVAGTPRITSEGEPILPIDAYALKLSEVQQIGLARDLLAGQCMREFGFSFDAAGFTAKSRKAAENDIKNHGEYGNKRRYGSPTLTHATRYGFRMPTQVDGTELPQPKSKEESKRNVRGLGYLTPAKELVLTGQAPDGKKAGSVNGQQVPGGGCLGEADSKLGGNPGEAPLVAKISRDSFNRSFTDSAVTAAFAKWSACVKAEGYNWPTPREAGTGFGQDNEAAASRGTAPPPKEIAAARANFLCQQQVKLVPIWSGFEAKYQKGQIDKNFEELEKIRKDQQNRLKFVSEIIAKR